jgi:uncharacterized protein YggL (DUF469 family)
VNYGRRFEKVYLFLTEVEGADFFLSPRAAFMLSQTLDRRIILKIDLKTMRTELSWQELGFSMSGSFKQGVEPSGHMTDEFLVKM